MNDRKSTIRISKSSTEESASLDRYNARLAQLAGLKHWPPQSLIEWERVCRRAGLDDTTIFRLMRTLGAPGFEEEQALPRALISAPIPQSKVNQPSDTLLVTQLLESRLSESDPSDDLPELALNLDVKPPTVTLGNHTHAVSDAQANIFAILAEAWKSGSQWVALSKDCPQAQRHIGDGKLPTALAAIIETRRGSGTRLKPGTFKFCR